jgi:zinc finger protein
MSEDIPNVTVVEGQPCPMCGKNTLKLTELAREIPYFGEVFIFSMTCKECHYHKSDVEPSETHEPSKFTLEVTTEEDQNIRVVKSSQATIKIPRIASIESGTASNGYVTNVEGIFNKIIEQIEKLRDDAEDKSERKKAKNLLKKLQDCKWGREPLKLIIEDPTGNSAIISEKAVKEKLKVK